MGPARIEGGGGAGIKREGMGSRVTWRHDHGRQILIAGGRRWRPQSLVFWAASLSACRVRDASSPSVQSPAVWTWTTLSPHRRGPVPHCSVRCPRSTVRVQESTVHGLLFRARDLAFVYFKARGTRAPYFSKRPGLHTRQCGRVTIRDSKERVLQYHLFHLCSPARPCLANAQIVHGVLCGCWVSYSCFPAKGRQFLALDQYCTAVVV